MSMSQYEATQYVASMIEAIQVLHAQARTVADEHDITFDITFEGGRNYNVEAEYVPNYSWEASNC